MDLVIRELQLIDEQTLLRAKDQWDHAKGFVFLPRFEEVESFSEYIELLDNQKKGIGLPTGYVADSAFFAFINEEIVGRVSIRHQLNDFLLQMGGHIGYGVLPQFRNKGIATHLLKFALHEARKLKIDSVLVTCDVSNLSSSRVIEKCGGVLEDIRFSERTQETKKRYWIKN